MAESNICLNKISIIAFPRHITLLFIRLNIFPLFLVTSFSPLEKNPRFFNHKTSLEGYFQPKGHARGLKCKNLSAFMTRLLLNRSNHAYLKSSILEELGRGQAFKLSFNTSMQRHSHTS